MVQTVYHKSIQDDPDSLDETFGLHPAFVDEVEDALLQKKKKRVRKLVVDLHPADLADLLEHLEPKTCRQLVETLKDQFNPEVLTELNDSVRDNVMHAMGFDDFASALAQLDSDEAVYIAGLLSPAQREAVFAKLPAADRMQIEASLAYGEETAGRLIQRELVSVPDYWTVGETIDYLRAARSLPDEFYVVFVVDPRHRPVGLVDLNRLVRSRRPVQMRDIVNVGMEIITPDMDREDVAYLFRQRDLVTAPVVEKSGRLIGQITIDDIVDVIGEEAEEDIFKLAGVSDSNLYGAVLATVRGRVSWLVLNLLTAIAASIVIGWFQPTIERLVALAVLMPIVASMGGNAGTQTLTVAVRSLATKDLDASNATRIIGKEVLAGLINGCLFAVLAGLVAYVWFQDVGLALVIAAAMVVNMLVAGFAGITIPIALNKFNIDPATSSAVFLTTVTDVVGFFVFLALAAFFLF
ncbi:MAG: magnesium transporter [Rhodospirillaceae bacterium]